MKPIKVIDQKQGNGWVLYHGDSCEVTQGIPDNVIGFSLFSPPFASLYTYTNSLRDLGNSKDMNEFSKHFEFMIGELFRVTMPGRLLSFHCMQLPKSKERDGVIGLRDFRGELIWLFEKFGWIFHSEVCIWKDPVTAMQRTKALGLLHKQIIKDSCMSRQGVPDYLVTMRKPGNNPERVDGMFESYAGEDATMPPQVSAAHDPVRYSIDVWQRYASPVWMDINPSDTLQRESARDDKDERHICPLQLQVIERALTMWSNPGDTVLSPFAGIGSEGYQAVKMGRKFIGCELKDSYFRQAYLNLAAAESQQKELIPLAECTTHRAVA